MNDREIEVYNFKEAQSYAFQLFFDMIFIILLLYFSLTFGVFGITRQLIFFLKTHVKFYSWSMFRLEDIDENVSGFW